MGYAKILTDRKLRNGNIEILRFIFCWLIIGLHYCEQFGNFGLLTFRGGYLGVEFFFAITGVFLAKSISEKKLVFSTNELFSYSRKSIIKKYLSILPFFAVSTILAFIIKSISTSLKSSIVSMTTLPMDFLAVSNYGLGGYSFTGILWYLSSMFFALIVLYPIIIKFYNVYVKYYSVPVFLISMGLIMCRFNTFNVPNKYIGILNTGFLRAVAMFSIGMFVYELSIVISKRDFSRLCITVIEVLSYLYTFLYMIFLQEIKELEIGMTTALFSMLVALSITLSKKSLFYGKFDDSFARFLGKSTMVLFMNHVYWFYNIDRLLILLNLEVPTSERMIILIFLIIISSAIVYIIGNKFKKIIQKKKKMI